MRYTTPNRAAMAFLPPAIPPSATIIAGGLGYVERQKHGADNRVSHIAVTKKGEALRPAFIAIARKLRSVSYRGIPDDDRETLARLLNEYLDESEEQ